MRPQLTVPAKLRPGARVAVLSPAFAAPGAFPAVHELALRYLTEQLDVETVEYPTTRLLDASARARATDLMAAFSDPEIGAVLASIGGDDLITVLPHLDAALIAEHPKAYCGYSDNTNVLNFLWNLGIAGYHGGSTMVHLGGRAGGPHPVSVASLRAALFTEDDLQLAPADRFGEDEADWNRPESLAEEGPTTAGEGWTWHQPGRVVCAPTWGGNLEILHWNLAAGRWIRPAEDYAGCVLLLETSEELPGSEEVFRMLRNMGERGLLEQFPAVLVGRAKAAHMGVPADALERARYRDGQRAAVLRAFSTYHPDAMLVFDVDLGHTDPQWVVPYGGAVTVDGPARSITAHYRAGPVTATS
jgi:muramoyltetrapeptide carboxypeptidase LdcA involved in peptidoglycan recycling